MAKKGKPRFAFMVNIFDDPDQVGALRFTFVPSNGAKNSAGGGPPEFIVTVAGHGEQATFNWRKPPADDQTRQLLEEEARQRVTIRYAWLDKLHRLVSQVGKWADSLDWSTKVVEKKFDDPEIGAYLVPALLLQHEVVRLFLEPISRAAPGAEGLVDLYLMPSYDDIASLYYYNDRWNVHYLFEGTASVGDIREAEAKPLTKRTLRQVFDEMKAHAE